MRNKQETIWEIVRLENGVGGNTDMLLLNETHPGFNGKSIPIALVPVDAFYTPKGYDDPIYREFMRTNTKKIKVKVTFEIIGEQDES